MTSLFEAAANGDVSAVQQQLPHAAAYDKGLALGAAAESGHTKVVALLLQAGADPCAGELSRVVYL